MSERHPAARHSVTVVIAGEKHVLRSDVSPDYTRSVAAHLDATISALGDAQSLDARRTTTLAALVITDELFRTRESLRLLQAELEKRSAALAALLEQATAEAQSPPLEAGAAAG